MLLGNTSLHQFWIRNTSTYRYVIGTYGISHYIYRYILMLIYTKININLMLNDRVEKCMVGFIKDRIGNICAPDLLLIGPNKEIIPVEIKCLPMAPTTDITNKSFYRELKLAKKQLSYAKLIIDNQYTIKVKTGLLIFVFFDKKIDVQYTLITY